MRREQPCGAETFPVTLQFLVWASGDERGSEVLYSQEKEEEEEEEGAAAVAANGGATGIVWTNRRKGYILVTDITDADCSSRPSKGNMEGVICVVFIIATRDAFVEDYQENP